MYVVADRSFNRAIANPIGKPTGDLLVPKDWKFQSRHRESDR